MRIIFGLIGIIFGIILIIKAKMVMDVLNRVGSGVGLETDEAEKLSKPRMIGVGLIVVSLLVMIGNPQIMTGLAGVGIGVFMIVKSFAIKNFFGTMAWAEDKLGSGGTVTLLKISGSVLIILSFLWMSGDTQTMFWGVMGQFFGLN